MSRQYREIIGLPTYESVEDDPTLLCRASFTSATNILNAAGAAVGAGISFDSSLGAKSTGDLTSRIFYDGPHPGAGAWDTDHTELATNQAFTFGFEVHRSVFEDGVNALAGTGTSSPLMFRGASNIGAIMFGRGAFVDPVTYNAVVQTNHPGATSVTQYCSRYANDKEMVPILLEFKKKEINCFVDGYHLARWARTAWVTTDYDDMYIVGRQFSSNSTPEGFPFYFRNFFAIRRRLVRPIDDKIDRLTILGDSFVAQGDYYNPGAIRVNTSHAGSNVDAGVTPLLERLAAREGFFTTDIHNSGRTGARINFVAGGADIMEQVNGSPSQTYFDALSSNGRIAVVVCGLNDALGETTTVEQIRTDLNTFLDAVVTGGFEQIVLCTVPDVSGATSVYGVYSVSAALARIQAINTMYAEEASARNNVHLVDLYTGWGPYDAANFRSDLLHPTEYLQSQMARLIWPKVKDARRAL